MMAFCVLRLGGEGETHSAKRIFHAWLDAGAEPTHTFTL